MLEFPELKENCIIIDSESKKRYSMWVLELVFSNQFSIASQSAMLFAQTRLSPVLIGQILATAAHNDVRNTSISVREEYTKRRNLLVELLNEIRV